MATTAKFTANGIRYQLIISPSSLQDERDKEREILSRVDKDGESTYSRYSQYAPQSKRERRGGK